MQRQRSVSISSKRAWCAVFAAMFVTVAAAGEVLAQARPSAPRSPRVFVQAGVGQQTAAPAFSHTLEPVIHAETARFDNRYVPKGGLLASFGGGVNLIRHLWVGVSFSLSNSTHGVEITGDVPHPFRFNDPRAISGTRDGVERSETGVHVQVMWRTMLAPRVGLAVFAGPSWLRLRQDLVETVTFSETYPYDEASYASASLTRPSSSALGYNAGAEVIYELTRRFGVGGQVRWSRATVTIGSDSTGDVDVTAGGLQATAGVRVAF